MHRIVAVIAGAAAVLGAGPGRAAVTPPVTVSPPGGTYVAPVSPLRVVRAFAPPAHRYGPGHLGVDLAVARGARIHAAAPGVVRFAGSVAGRGLVVVVHPDGISTEYEPLTVAVHTGEIVTPTTVVGRVHGTHPGAGCARDRCLHWGAKRGTEYLDPMSLLRPLGPVRLLPYP